MIISDKILSCVLFAAGLAQNPTSTSGQVEIEILTYLNEKITHAEVSIFEQGSRTDFNSSIKYINGRISARLPYGSYVLRVFAAGFHAAEQRVLVYQDHVSFRVFLRVGVISDEVPRTLSGRVSPAPGRPGVLWVKLAPLLSTEEIVETGVAADGSFELTGLPPGEFALAVMKGTEVLLLRPISIYGRMTVRLELPERPLR